MTCHLINTVVLLQKPNWNNFSLMLWPVSMAFPSWRSIA